MAEYTRDRFTSLDAALDAAANNYDDAVVLFMVAHGDISEGDSGTFDDNSNKNGYVAISDLGSVGYYRRPFVASNIRQEAQEKLSDIDSVTIYWRTRVGY